MGKLRVAVLPKCNFDCCNDAKYDAPTRSGSWANMCPDHAVMHGVNVKLLGTEFVLGIAEPKGGDPIQGVMDLERSMAEDMLIVICPECKDEKHLELDATGTYVCDGCGFTVNIPSIV